MHTVYIYTISDGVFNCGIKQQTEKTLGIFERFLLIQLKCDFSSIASLQCNCEATYIGAIYIEGTRARIMKGKFIFERFYKVDRNNSKN